MSAPIPEIEAQSRYARWLAWGTRAGLALLVLAFCAYVLGLVEPRVPIGEVASLWSRSSADFLQATAARPGWEWARSLHRADMLALAAIAFLASWSIACLAAAIPVFARRRERVLVAICALQITVLLLAASAVL